MPRFLGGLTRDVVPTLALAGPVILAEIGWVTMGVADTMIVGWLGAESLGAVGVGGTMFFAVAVFGMGMLLGLDTLVSQASGAGLRDECHRTLAQGLYLAVAISVPLTALVMVGVPVFRAAGVRPEVVRLAVPYTRTIAWSLGPLLVFTAFRRYLQSIERVGVFVFLMITANIVNVVADWALGYGHLGSRAFGVRGFALATVLMYSYMALFVAAYTVWQDPRVIPRPFPRPDGARLRRLLALGTPAAVQMTLETGIYAVATLLAGRLDPASLAAHQVVQTLAGLTAMTSVGLATAATVRVGHAGGRGDAPAAALAGWTAIALGVSIMAGAAVVLFVFPRPIIAAFTGDASVVATGVVLLGFVAAFQMFDGLQAVTTGALRGLGDTRTPMRVSLLAHWTLGLPVGYTLAFRFGMGVSGLWAGLSVGLIVTGLVLIRVWIVKARTIVPLTRSVAGPPVERCELR